MMKLRKGSTKQTVQFSEAELYPLIGNSACIHELRNAIKKYAQCDAEVLIQGETGVGKGLCARLIHQLSSRRSSPFVEVNCGAIPSGLIASELLATKKVHLQVPFLTGLVLFKKHTKALYFSMRLEICLRIFKYISFTF